LRMDTLYTPLESLGLEKNVAVALLGLGSCC
jgi:hypothetical protein